MMLGQPLAQSLQQSGFVWAGSTADDHKWTEPLSKSIASVVGFKLL